MRDFISETLERFKASSIGKKLFAFFMALVVCPVVALSLYLYFESVSIITSQARSINELYLDQISSLISNELNHNANVSNLLAQNDSIRETLALDPTTLSFSEEFEQIDDVMKLLSNTQVTQDVFQIRLYVNDNFRYSRRNQVLYSLHTIEEESWYQTLIEGNQRYVLLPPYQFKYTFNEEAEIVSIASLVRNRTDMNHVIGVVITDISVSQLLEIIQGSAFTKSSEILILDNLGNIVISDENVREMFSELVKDVSPDMNGETRTGIYGDYLIGTSDRIFNDWQVLSITPLSEFNKVNVDLRNSAILLVILIAILAGYFVRKLSRYYSRRISHLSRLMGKAEKGNLNVSIVVDSGDEIGMLQNSFNFMIRRLKSLVQEKYKLGQELKGVELKVLQEQINPHFLYNTLDMIYWMTMDRDNPEIADIVLKLAQFYRLSLQRGRNTVRLSDEIKQTELFIELLNLRSKKRVSLVLDLSDTAAGSEIMKLTLQPLIENAIIHGIFPSEKAEGVITVSARAESGYLHLSVHDNGVGMSAEQLRNLRQFIDVNQHKDDEDSGFGLKNTVNRLKISFGDDFYFDIESGADIGSKVSFTIPLIDRPDTERPGG